MTDRRRFLAKAGGGMAAVAAAAIADAPNVIAKAGGLVPPRATARLGESS